MTLRARILQAKTMSLARNGKLPVVPMSLSAMGRAHLPFSPECPSYVPGPFSLSAISLPPMSLAHDKVPDPISTTHPLEYALFQFDGVPI